MDSSKHIEVEAAKLLQKLIQESTDEPAKLATKLHVICQHMKLSGKEHSLPYLVISRAMETVINQHGLDIDDIRSSSAPSTSGTQIANPGGTMSRDKGSVGIPDVLRHGSFGSNWPSASGPSRVDVAGADVHQGSLSHLSSKSSGLSSPSSHQMEDMKSANSQEKQVSTKADESATKKGGGSKRKKPEPKTASKPRTEQNPPNATSKKGKQVGKASTSGKISMPGQQAKGADREQTNLAQNNLNQEGQSSAPGAAGTFVRAHQEGSFAFGGNRMTIPTGNNLELHRGNIAPGTGAYNSFAWNQNSQLAALKNQQLISANRITNLGGHGTLSGERAKMHNTAATLFHGSNYLVSKNSESSSGSKFIGMGERQDRLPINAEATMPESRISGQLNRNAGLSLVPRSSNLNNPFQEQQLKQLRAQCLVFLAFRNNVPPRKVHLEIALDRNIPAESQRGHDNSERESANSHEGSGMLGKQNDAATLSSSSHASAMDTDISSKDVEPAKKKIKRPQDHEKVVSDVENQTNKKMTGPVSCVPEGAGTTSYMMGATFVGDSVNAADVKLDKDNLNKHVGWETQVTSLLGDSKHMAKHETPVLSADRVHDALPKEALANSMVRHMLADGNNSIAAKGSASVVVGREVENNTTAGNMIFDKSAEKAEESEADFDGSKLPSPKYTMSEKWIMSFRKRRREDELTWMSKQRKAGERISSCFEKLKETVSSCEDISAKTKSVIELKKIHLLQLQRRLRSEFLSDFFKPVASDMDRIKSVKKYKHGRRVKQLEKVEQKMKEERQKRIRERQKEFFADLEVHRERLDDFFKAKRERAKGLNRHVKDFHKRKERIYREKIDRIQREKINLLKNNDVEGYLRMVQDTKSDRVKQLLKETEKYLQKLGSRLRGAKSMARRFEVGVDENQSGDGLDKNDYEIEDEGYQAQHYLESNEKYYQLAHSVKEMITEQPTFLLGGKLREYQMNGLRWLVSLYNNNLNGILADEMGLGKTVQVISLMCYLMENKNDRGPFLVVVPSSVLPGWESELNFWAPSINKIVYSGPPEERRRLFKEVLVHEKFNVLLTTYEYMMNKHDRPKLSKIHWHYIIIDEGHRLKNASCKLNADLKHYRSSHRLLLTGTPLQNNLEELWALLNFLLPNIFNSSEDFSQWFNKPFESNGDNSPEEALLSEEENLLIINRLHQVLRPFVLRRLKHKVEHELPEKIERLVRCEASAYQKLLMKRVEENLGGIGNVKARSIHNSVMELRNICNHPYLSQLHVDEIDSHLPRHYLPSIVRLCGKLEMLDRLLPKLKATGHRVLLFSTMTRLLDVMEDYLVWRKYRYLRLDGHTSGLERGSLIEQFNHPESQAFIFLLSIRAGGVGVNLQAADTVIIFDTDWNPQVDLQAQARAHRIGQKKEVLVLRLETVRTVEEHVRAAAEHKLGVANQSITAGFFDNNTSAEDRREYLESLLRESKKEEAASVLDDDALNEMLARSESEIDVFESIDKQRQEEELLSWKTIVQESSVEGLDLSAVPPRLVTEEDLKSFYKAMKIHDSPKVKVNVDIKRKGETLGGVDMQQYGRGRRAREVRYYEDQWTEEEFEKLCQADSPGSSPPHAIGEGRMLGRGKREAFKDSLPTADDTPTKRGRGRPPGRGRARKTAILSPGSIDSGAHHVVDSSVPIVIVDVENEATTTETRQAQEDGGVTSAAISPSSGRTISVRGRGRGRRGGESSRGRGRKSRGRGFSDAGDTDMVIGASVGAGALASASAGTSSAQTYPSIGAPVIPHGVYQVTSASGLHKADLISPQASSSAGEKSDNVPGDMCARTVSNVDDSSVQQLNTQAADSSVLAQTAVGQALQPCASASLKDAEGSHHIERTNKPAKGPANAPGACQANLSTISEGNADPGAENDQAELTTKGKNRGRGSKSTNAGRKVGVQEAKTRRGAVTASSGRRARKSVSKNKDDLENLDVSEAVVVTMPSTVHDEKEDILQTEVTPKSSVVRKTDCQQTELAVCPMEMVSASSEADMKSSQAGEFCSVQKKADSRQDNSSDCPADHGAVVLESSKSVKSLRAVASISKGELDHILGDGPSKSIISSAQVEQLLVKHIPGELPLKSSISPTLEHVTVEVPPGYRPLPAQLVLSSVEHVFDEASQKTSISTKVEQPLEQSSGEALSTSTCSPMQEHSIIQPNEAIIGDSKDVDFIKPDEAVVPNVTEGNSDGTDPLNSEFDKSTEIAEDPMLVDKNSGEDDAEKCDINVKDVKTSSEAPDAPALSPTTDPVQSRLPLSLVPYEDDEEESEDMMQTDVANDTLQVATSLDEASLTEPAAEKESYPNSSVKDDVRTIRGSEMPKILGSDEEPFKKTDMTIERHSDSMVNTEEHPSCKESYDEACAEDHRAAVVRGSSAAINEEATDGSDRPFGEENTNQDGDCKGTVSSVIDRAEDVLVVDKNTDSVHESSADSISVEEKANSGDILKASGHREVTGSEEILETRHSGLEISDPNHQEELTGCETCVGMKGSGLASSDSYQLEKLPENDDSCQMEELPENDKDEETKDSAFSSSGFDCEGMLAGVKKPEEIGSSSTDQRELPNITKSGDMEGLVLTSPCLYQQEKMKVTLLASSDIDNQEELTRSLQCMTPDLDHQGELTGNKKCEEIEGPGSEKPEEMQGAHWTTSDLECQEGFIGSKIQELQGSGPTGSDFDRVTEELEHKGILSSELDQPEEPATVSESCMEVVGSGMISSDLHQQAQLTGIEEQDEGKSARCASSGIVQQQEPASHEFKEMKHDKKQEGEKDPNLTRSSAPCETHEIHSETSPPPAEECKDVEMPVASKVRVTETTKQEESASAPSQTLTEAEAESRLEKDSEN